MHHAVLAVALSTLRGPTEIETALAHALVGEADAGVKLAIARALLPLEHGENAFETRTDLDVPGQRYSSYSRRDGRCDFRAVFQKRRTRAVESCATPP